MTPPHKLLVVHLEQWVSGGQELGVEHELERSEYMHFNLKTRAKEVGLEYLHFDLKQTQAGVVKVKVRVHAL